MRRASKVHFIIFFVKYITPWRLLPSLFGRYSVRRDLFFDYFSGGDPLKPPYPPGALRGLLPEGLSLFILRIKLYNIICIILYLHEVIFLSIHSTIGSQNLYMRYFLKAHYLLYNSTSLLCYHIVCGRKRIEVRTIWRNEVLETFLSGYRGYPRYLE